MCKLAAILCRCVCYGSRRIHQFQPSHARVSNYKLDVYRKKKVYQSPCAEREEKAVMSLTCYWMVTHNVIMLCLTLNLIA